MPRNISSRPRTLLIWPVSQLSEDSNCKMQEMRSLQWIHTSTSTIRIAKTSQSKTGHSINRCGILNVRSSRGEAGHILLRHHSQKIQRTTATDASHGENARADVTQDRHPYSPDNAVHDRANPGVYFLGDRPTKWLSDGRSI
jgi:hypothetical protein